MRFFQAIAYSCLGKGRGGKPAVSSSGVLSQSSQPSGLSHFSRQVSRSAAASTMAANGSPSGAASALRSNPVGKGNVSTIDHYSGS